MRGSISLLLVLICCAGHFAFGDDVITGYGNAPANPQVPGYHKLVYHYTDQGKSCQLSFLLYLPNSYVAPATQPSTRSVTQAAASFPMLVFMSGLGERGSDPQMLLTSGVPHDLAERPEVMKWMPMIMVGPQCPADARYEDERVGRGITGLIDELSKRYPIDTQRRYITGFSMGGTGCWSVARYARDRLAVVAPIVPRGFQPLVLGEALAGTGTTCLIVSGEVDAKSEPGSSEMVKALRARGVDVVYAMIPKGDHYLWPWYYHDKRFYEWLLSHRQGAPKPAERMGDAAIVEMARERMNYNNQYLTKIANDLQSFAPWWHIDNCSLWGEQGLLKEVNGKHDVFETRAYYYEVPCRLQCTQTLPKADHVTLHLVVGRHPAGDWKLTVRVNEQDVFTTPINKDTAPESWKAIDVDLTPYAGQEVRLQLCQSGLANFGSGQAYWEAIKILSTATTQPAPH